MRTLFYFLIVACICLFLFSSCSTDEVVVPIELESISKLYKGDELRIFLNGEEYSSPNEEVRLALPSLVSKDMKNEDVSVGEKMLMELLPIWPNIRDFSISSNEFENILVEVETVSTPEEVCLKGSYTDAMQYYTLDVEGYCRDGILTLYLNYTTKISYITGNAFTFDFSKESIDLSHLKPKIENVEYDGQLIPVEEFVRNAMAPVFETIGRRLGGSLRIEFLSDGSTNVSIKMQGEDTYTPVIGKHGYCFHRSCWGYLFADTEGASWMNELVTGTSLWGVSPLYGWRARDKYFISVYYSLNGDLDLLMTLETPEMFQFRFFLAPWIDRFGTYIDNYPFNTELSKEETFKSVHVINMMYDKQIELVCLKGIRG